MKVNRVQNNTGPHRLLLYGQFVFFHVPQNKENHTGLQRHQQMMASFSFYPSKFNFKQLENNEHVMGLSNGKSVRFSAPQVYQKQFGHSWELEICRKTLSGVTASNHSYLNHEVFLSFSTCTCLPPSNRGSRKEVQGICWLSVPWYVSFDEILCGLSLKCLI